MLHAEKTDTAELLGAFLERLIATGQKMDLRNTGLRDCELNSSSSG
jgi:hypothetical protein